MEPTSFGASSASNLFTIALPELAQNRVRSEQSIEEGYFMDEVITPKLSIQHYIERRGIRIEDIGVATQVIISWGSNMISQMAEKIGAQKSEHWFYGNRQMFFTGRIEGKPVSLVEMPVGAPGTVMIMEEMIAAGARTFIGFGWAGSLQRDLPIGSFIVPTGCISEEGTSRHYFDPLPELTSDSDLSEALASEADEYGILYRKGLHWTTDAPYRELRSKVDKYRSEGVLGVDMETSAMYALAKFRGVRVSNLLVVSDVLDAEWKPGFGTDVIMRANEMAQQIVLACIAQ